MILSAKLALTSVCSRIQLVNLNMMTNRCLWTFGQNSDDLYALMSHLIIISSLTEPVLLNFSIILFAVDELETFYQLNIEGPLQMVANKLSLF